MRLAIASNNGVTIQRHFGRTRQYVVATIEDGHEVARDLRTMDPEQQGLEMGCHGPDHNHFDQRLRVMLSPVTDCDTFVVGGLGIPMLQAAETSGMNLILTSERLVDDIVASYLAGTLEHEPDLAHEPCH